ncbi:DUF2255 family protein [Pseudactinotalea terrae]|uniref:DUF2255 family protein n=1 Tax=Pseudactinotalea terrae TaxID=1743262 RepID=UPI0012E2040E|nr:DUF2255 family protein [Pseudactinotalea terrae]
MTLWKPAELTAIDAERESTVAAHRPDGTLRTPRIIWHVVAGGQLFIRSVRGTEGAWYRGVERTGTGVFEAGGIRAEVALVRDSAHDAAIDQAYRAKYGTGSAVLAITNPTATATTLRVDPR